MEAWPKVFIIILNYNGGEFLKNCLESVRDIDYPDFSVLVVDNGSQDGSFQAVPGNFPGVLTLDNGKNLGFAAGNNTGIRYALDHKADYVLLLNQDTEVESDFLKKLMVAAREHPKAGILSPLIFWKRTAEVWFSEGWINWLTMKSHHKKELRSGTPYESGFITGCSMLIKKEVLTEIGLLSEKYFLYWEDADFSLEARRHGFSTLVVPESRIYHFEAYTEPAGNKLYWLVFSGLIFFKRNAPAWARIWISLYYGLRKIKNRIDIALRPSDNARVVQKAYYDFDQGKY